jgi:hypothetical protein
VQRVYTVVVSTSPQSNEDENWWHFQSSFVFDCQFSSTAPNYEFVLIWPVYVSYPVNSRTTICLIWPGLAGHIWDQRLHDRSCLLSKSIFIFFPLSISSKTLCIKTPEGANRKFIQAVKPFIRVLRLSILIRTRLQVSQMHVCLNFYYHKSLKPVQIRKSTKYYVHPFTANLSQYLTIFKK